MCPWWAWDSCAGLLELHGARTASLTTESPRTTHSDDNGGSLRATGAATTTVTTHVEEEDPPNFSRVDLSLPSAALVRRFPLFPGPSSAAMCEVGLRANHMQPLALALPLDFSKPSYVLVRQVNAGEMLYLPAGWFHEVTSFGGRRSGGHLAFNYWMHPPDHLHPTDGFSTPYKSAYWPEYWARSEYAKMEAARRAEAASVEQQRGGKKQEERRTRRRRRTGRSVLIPLTAQPQRDLRVVLTQFALNKRRRRSGYVITQNILQ